MDATVIAEIDKLLYQAEHVSLLSGMEKLYAYLRTKGLMYSAQISSKYIGCHEQNRDGCGVDPQHVHNLVDTFHKMGFVPMGKYLAVEVPLNAHGDKTRGFNQELVNGSNGLFPGLFKQGPCILVVSKYGFFNLGFVG